MILLCNKLNASVDIIKVMQSCKKLSNANIYRRLNAVSI